MGIKIANDMGAADKSIDTMLIANDAGSIDKNVSAVFLANDIGAIDKKVFPNWVYSTGETLKSSAGGAIMGPASSRVLSAQVTTAVRPVTLKYITSLKKEEYESGEVRIEVEHSYDGINYTMLQAEDITVSTDYLYPYEVTFSMDGQTDVKYVRYRIKNISSYDISTGTLVGKCTAWWGVG